MSGAVVTAEAVARRSWLKPSISRERRWALWVSYIVLIFFAIGFLAPPYFELITALKTSQQLGSGKDPWFTAHPYFGNFIGIITNPDFQTFFLNTVKVTIIVVALTLVMSILAAYALARMRFFGSQVFATGVFLTYLVPESLLFIPLFKVLSFLHLINSTWCLVLIWPTLSVPFCTWIMIGYFSSIPKELDEAAMIDGASHLQMLWKIFIPVALPGIIAATIFAFTVCWGDFLYPLAYLFTGKQMVLTAGIVSDLIHGDVLDWGHIMAANVVASAPPVIIYAFLMDYYIAGLTAGATKG
ncbi:MAG TPA: carbohydrate ABC transporter permease [Acetobacteraceae bacterium]|nr:carbohydrate ABC transporter permease [Acetobacteraceae bacterium]